MVIRAADINHHTREKRRECHPGPHTHTHRHIFHLFLAHWLAGPNSPHPVTRVAAPGIPSFECRHSFLSYPLLLCPSLSLNSRDTKLVCNARAHRYETHTRARELFFHPLSVTNESHRPTFRERFFCPLLFYLLWLFNVSPKIKYLLWLSVPTEHAHKHLDSV